MSKATARVDELGARRQRRYPAYKEAGADWLGKIPVGWQLTKLKHVAAVQASSVDKNRQENEIDVRFLGTDTVYNVSEIRNDLRLETASVSTKEIHDYSLHEGDVVLTKDSVVPTRIADVSIVAEPLENVVCGYHLTMIRPDLSKVLPRYLFWYLGCSAVNGFFLSESRGTTIIGLSSSTIGGARIMRPSNGEQRAIADFVDRETAKIDVLVERKQRLIELLQEKRAALINRAVTQGLDPNVATKDSGVEWLGEIPAHWEIRQGRYLYRAVNLPPRAEDSVVTAYRNGQVTLRVNRRAEGYTFAIQEIGYQHVRTGDLVIQGMDAFAGAIGVSDSSGKCSPEYLVLEPLIKDTDNRYFAAALRLMAWRRYILVVCNAVRERAPRFRLPEFRNVFLPRPPETEQRLISDFIERETAEIDKLVGRVQDAIGYLHELRTALISAAVTGKIDVREVVPR